MTEPYDRISPEERAQDPQLTALLGTLLKHHPEANVELVAKAFSYAAKAHEGQKRKNGKPYFTHPYRVAEILASLTLDDTTVAAGLLHDCVEDNENICVKEIETEFSPEIAFLVDGVTKLDKLDFTSREERQAESLRKMFMAMAKDTRVIIIKLADRLHNMRTLKFQNPTRQVPIARETLDIYAPLAHRLGMSNIKWELEDLALRYIDPTHYYELVELVGMKRDERENAIQQVISQIREQLDKQGIEAEIDGRPKHFYSIYRKMYQQNKAFDEIYDLIAVRIIVDTKQDCYASLGVVHTMWTQVPGRFKDYISMPKPNMYQSLHTTLVAQNGLTFEVQIRTKEMHRTSEFGIAAHWNYKEGKTDGKQTNQDMKLLWLRQILDWQSETRDPNEFMDALKTDLFADEVVVFTPKGDVVSLPKGATPLDFAFRIHTAIGCKCVGAKINGRIVPLGTELQTGDFVEVMTSSSSKGPSRDWLQLVHTSEARTKIRSYFKKEFKDDNLARGKEMLEREAKRLGYSLPQLTTSEILENVCKRYTLSSLEDLYVTVGFGGLSTAQVLNRMVEEHRKRNKIEAPKPTLRIDKPQPDNKPKAPKSVHGVIVEGDPGMLVRFAKCCNPLPGDDIVGYITRGRGVSVHRADCTNMRGSGDENMRMISVEWEGNISAAYDADICIRAYDRAGLLADLSHLFFTLEVPIAAISARTDKSEATVGINLTLSVKNTQQLENIIRQLRKRSEVIEVFRPST